jgi:sugar phosphate isomerase/epimerase
MDPRLGMVASRFEHLERIESYGLQRVELVILLREEESDIRRFLARTNVALSVHCPLFRDAGLDDYPLLAAVFDTDRDRQDRALRLMESEVAQAADCGARYMVAHLQRSIGVLGEEVPAGWDDARARDAARRGGERLAVAAERAGIPIHVENMMSHPLLALPEHYEAFFGSLPVQWLKMCYDVGHAALDAAKFGFCALQFAAQMADRIGSLHVYNNQITDDFDFATLRAEGRLRKFPAHPDQNAQEGWIDLENVLGAVLARNPDALVTFEVYFALDTERDTTRRGLEWVAGLCERIGSREAGRAVG